MAWPVAGELRYSKESTAPRSKLRHSISSGSVLVPPSEKKGSGPLDDSLLAEGLVIQCGQAISSLFFKRIFH